MPRRRTDIDNQKERIINLLLQGESRESICRGLKCKPATLVSRLNKWGVGHLKNQFGKGSYRQRMSAFEYLSKSKNPKTRSVRLKLLEDGVKEHKCEVCGITEWRGQPAPLELDHVDGNRFNWEFSNLRIICPNCHAQTETYCRSNTPG